MRRLLAVLPILCALALPLAAQAQPVLAGPTAPVLPLQPAAVQVSVPGYSGPATLLLFDGAGQFAGQYDLQVEGGAGTAIIVPHGAPGPAFGALFVNGARVADAPGLYTLAVSTQIWTGQTHIDALWPRIRGYLDASRLSYPLDGASVHGFRSPDSPLIWLRDHVSMLQTARYFDPDPRSALDAFARAQQPDGSLPDFLARPEINTPAWRTPVEADVEYLFIQGVYAAWQATGDDAWLAARLPALRRAAAYTLSHPLRWEPALGLIKRPLTIDTWDFEIGPATIDPNTGQPAPRHWIDHRTTFSIFHGDNTGMAAALRLLARIEARVGDPVAAHAYRQLADDILVRLNALAWNGAFYAHHVPLAPPPDLGGVDLRTQLSLSNALALTRGVLTLDQARAILAEYRTRLARPDNLAFAEWWSIDPPFPPGVIGLGTGMGERPGEYVNGSLMPLVGGALARGAFEYGEEAYGFDLLRRYDALTARTGASYLWYAPTGGPGIGYHTIPTDGWGSGMMLAALIGGAAGVVDDAAGFEQVTLSPRWPAAADISSAYVAVHYPASSRYVAYWWHSAPGSLQFDVTGSASHSTLRLLLPADAGAIPQVSVNAAAVEPVIEIVGASRYLVLSHPGPLIRVRVTW